METGANTTDKVSNYTIITSILRHDIVGFNVPLDTL